MRPSLETIRGLANFTQMFRWYVEFEKFPNLVPGPGSDAINWRAESIGIPKLNPMSTEYQIRGHKVKQPGIGDYENTIVLTCIETIDNVISQFVHDWQEVCWESENGSTGKTNSKEDIEAIVRLTRLDNMDQPIWVYKLFGCYLETSDSGGDLDGATSDPLKPALTLSFDYFNAKPL